MILEDKQPISFLNQLSWKVYSQGYIAKYKGLLEVNNEAQKDTAVWELLRVDTTSPVVVLVDPEGDSPNIPIPPIEPSGTVGIFEGQFEFVFAG